MATSTTEYRGYRLERDDARKEKGGKVAIFRGPELIAFRRSFTAAMSSVDKLNRFFNEEQPSQKG